VSSPKSVPPFPRPIEPPRRPFLWAAFAYGAGIVAGANAWRPVSWWVIAAAAFIAAGAYFRRRRIAFGFALALGALFFVGALGIQLRKGEQVPGGEILAFANGDETMVTAHVMHGGEIRAGSYGGSRQTIDVETEEIQTDEGNRAIRAGLRLGIYTRNSDPEYEEDGKLTAMRVYR